jgi:hypothetical protein
MSDRIHDTLTTLRSDVERASLADSAAVRRRGNQRTRRQAAGSALAALVVVAAAVGISGALNSTDSSIDQLPASPGPTTATSTTSSAPSDAATFPPLTTGVLLKVSDLPRVPNQTFSIGETLPRATTKDAADRSLQLCGIGPSDDIVPKTAVLRTFPSELEAFAWQWVAQYRSAEEADLAAGKLETTCHSGGATVSAAGGGTGVVVSRFSADPGSEYNGEMAGIARVNDSVVVVALRAMVKKGEVDLQQLDVALGDAAALVASR